MPFSVGGFRIYFSRLPVIRAGLIALCRLAFTILLAAQVSPPARGTARPHRRDVNLTAAATSPNPSLYTTSSAGQPINSAWRAAEPSTPARRDRPVIELARGTPRVAPAIAAQPQGDLP